MAAKKLDILHECSIYTAHANILNMLLSYSVNS